MSEEKYTLAAKIARGIFEVGDESPSYGGKTQRIQFMGGEWPDEEVPMGGLNETALIATIAEILANE